MWYLCLEYVTYILNRLSTPSLNGKTPRLSMINSQIPDISIIQYYRFYEPVYYAHYDSSTKTQPVDTTSERLGYLAGFSANVGHAFTFLVVSHNTREVLHRSRLRSAKDGEQNLRSDVASNKIMASDIADTYELLASHKFKTFDISDAYDTKELPPTRNGEPPHGEPHHGEHHHGEPHLGKEHLPEVSDTDREEPPDPEPPPTLLSSSYDTRLLTGELFPIHDPETLIGQTFLLPPQADGNQDRAEIIELIQQYKDDVIKNPEHVRFRLKINNSDIYENLVSYSQDLDYIEKNSKEHSDNPDRVWKLNRISRH
jgi:hypothetical protein